MIRPMEAILKLAAAFAIVPRDGNWTGKYIHLITILQNFLWWDSIHQSIANYVILPLFLPMPEQNALTVIPTCITRLWDLIVPGATQQNHGSLTILQIFTGKAVFHFKGHTYWLNVWIVIHLHHFFVLNRCELNASIATRMIILLQPIQTMSRGTYPPIAWSAIQ